MTESLGSAITWGEYAKRLQAAVDYVKGKAPFDAPDVGIVLGSGLGALGDVISGSVKVPYSEIPGMLVPSVQGHAGSVILGELGGKKVMCLAGRSHGYEGYFPHEIQFGARLLALSGVKIVLLTAATGSSDPRHSIGELVALRDHLNSTHRGYATGPLRQDLGDLYALCAASQLATQTGVYSYVPGPSYETPSETAGLTHAGASLFGMSTVPEVIALKELGVPVAAFGFVSNLAAGFSTQPLNHLEVCAAVEAAGPTVCRKFIELLTGLTLPCCCKKVEFAPPCLDRRISVPSPVPLDAAAASAAIDTILGGTKLSSVTVLARGHTTAGIRKLKISVRVPLEKFDKFPLCEHEHAQVEIGSFEGTPALHAFVSGVGHGGLQPAALAYLVEGFKHLGVTDYVQTFATFGGASEASVVGDVNNWFEPFVFLRCYGRPLVNPAVAPGVRRCSLGTYHGPEYPTPSEVRLMREGGSDEFAIDSATGLIYAQAQGLKATGIADGGNICEALGLVAATLADFGTLGEAPAVTLGVGGKALLWNDIPPAPVHVQETQEEIDAMAAKLPDVSAVVVFNSKFPPCFRALTEGETPLDLGLPEPFGAFEKTIKDKKVILCGNNHLVLRAAVKKGIKILGLSSVQALGALPTGELVTVVDHINPMGLSPLIGANKTGVRFPPADHCYKVIPGLKQVKSILSPFMLAQPGTDRAGKALGADVFTLFGPREAIVVKHAEGTFAHVGFVVNGRYVQWQVTADRLYDLISEL